MLDGVLDERLKEQRRHVHVERGGVEILGHREPVAEADALDGEIAVRERELLAKRDRGALRHSERRPEGLKLGLTGQGLQLRSAPLLIAGRFRGVEHVVHRENEEVQEDAEEEDDGAGLGKSVGQGGEGREQRERPRERRPREKPQGGRDDRGDDERRRGRFTR